MRHDSRSWSIKPVGDTFTVRDDEDVEVCTVSPEHQRTAEVIAELPNIARKFSWLYDELNSWIEAQYGGTTLVCNELEDLVQLLPLKQRLDAFANVAKSKTPTPRVQSAPTTTVYDVEKDVERELAPMYLSGKLVGYVDTDSIPSGGLTL